METTLAPGLSHTRKAVFACYFAMGVVFASWASRIPDIKTALNLSDGQLGKALFAIPIGQLICLQFSGKLVTRLGSHRTLSVFLPAYALSTVMLGAVTQPWQLATALFFFGVIGNLASISVNTQGVLTEKLYGRSIMASFHGGWSLAGFTGGVIGFLAINLGLTPLSHFALVSAAVCVLLPLCRPFLAPALPSAPPPPAGRSRWGRPDPMLLQLGIIGFCSMGTEGAMFDWSGVYFKDVIHAPPSLVVLGYTSFMVMMATGRFLADPLVARYGRRRIMRLSGLVISFGLFSAVLFPTLVPCTLAFMLVGLGVSSIVPTCYSLAGQNPNVDASNALATVASVSFLGFLLGPPLIGTVAAYSSLRFSYAIIACFGLCIPYLVERNSQIR